MDEEPLTEPSDFTVREKIIATIIGLPLTYGLALLCGHLEGVDKSGWIWWIPAFGLVFSGAITVGTGCSLVWSLLLSTGIMSRIGQVMEGSISRIGQVMEGSISWIGQVIMWILQTIVYIAIVSYFISLASNIFDDLNNLNNRELLFFALGGFVVYVYLNRDQ